MFVHFAIDHLAFGEDMKNPHERIDRHQDLAELWADLGILVFDGEEWSKSGVYKAINSLPVQFRKLWQEYYKRHNTRTRGNVQLTEVFCEKSSNSVAKISTVVDVLFSGDELSSLLLGKPNKKRSFVEGVEIVRFGSCGRSATFKDVRSLRTLEIPRKTPTDAIWEERFKPLALLSRSIRVVDQYAVRNCFENRKTAGLKSFVSHLSKMRKSFDLVIYASKFDYDIEEISALLASMISPTDPDSIKSVELFVLEEHLFRRERHGRFVRFDSFVCETDKGISVLDGDQLTGPAQYTMKTVEPTHRETEKNLRFHGESIIIR